MEQTLLKVKNLGKFIQKHGDDPFFSNTISKMLEYKIQEYDDEIKKLRKELKKYERKYQKASHVFFREFKEGKAGDALDFVEWSSLYQILNRLIEKKSALKGVPIND